MNLPKIEHPTFTLFLPISERKISFRPMLVKEEKILLLAKESNDDGTIVENIKNVIQNCVYDKLDFDDLPLAEVEFIFLNIRAKSINNIITVNVTDRYVPNKKHQLDVDLEEVTIRFNKELNPTINLEENLGIVLKYPTINLIKSLATNPEEDPGIITFKNCLLSVFDSENVYKIKDVSEKEVDMFIDNLSPKHLEKIKEFFDNVPKLHFEIKFLNSKNQPDSVVLDTFRDFFS